MMRCWRGYLSEARLIWSNCNLIISCFIKFQIGLTFLWYRLTQILLKKRPLNMFCHMEYQRRVQFSLCGVV